MIVKLIFGFAAFTLFSMILYYYTLHEAHVGKEIYAGLIKNDRMHYTTFYPCGTKSRWSIEFAMNYSSRMKFPKRRSPRAPVQDPVFIELEGYLSKAGGYGPNSDYSHVLEATKVIRIGSTNEAANCEPLQT